MFKDELKQFVLDNPKLVSMKPAGDGIFVLKYKKTVFYDNLWNDFLEECRGTIVDADFNVVSRPFTKIYNYGVEAKAPVLSDDTPLAVFRKVNGFMVAVTVHNGKLLISTTGSTTNDYVEYAKEMMETHSPLSEWLSLLKVRELENLTFMFECVHPSDPHIIPEKPGMYMLGYRAKSWDSKIGIDLTMMTDISGLLRCHPPEYTYATLGKLKTMVKECRHEGYVFYGMHNISAKIKSPYYLTSKWVARNPRTDKLVNMQADIKQNLDEEYYPLVDAIRANIEDYTAMDEQARLAWVRNYLETV